MRPHIDDWLQEAYDATDMKGVEIPDDQLGHLSQAYRSSDGLDILEEETGIGLASRDKLTLLFSQIADGTLDLAKVLNSPRLAHFAGRNGAFNID